MADHNDDLLNRAINELREMPPLDQGAVSRIVSAAARAREMGPAEEDDLAEPRRGGRRIFRLPAVASIAAAAAIIGFMAGSFEGRGSQVADQRVAVDSASPTIVATVPAQPPVVAVSATTADANGPIETRFEFDSPAAQRVSLVGDFNSWDDQAIVLQRVPGTQSRWAAVVKLIPGRHMYAFMVDGQLQVDPQAPKAKDRELGVTTSVVIVGKP